MVGWHHQLNGHEFEQTLGDGEGQGGLACCSPSGHKESDRTERRNSVSGEEDQPGRRVTAAVVMSAEAGAGVLVRAGNDALRLHDYVH